MFSSNVEVDLPNGPHHRSFGEYTSPGVQSVSRRWEVEHTECLDIP